MHEDFSKKHFPFTAAILRDGQADKKVIPKCTTVAGFLCSLESRKNAKGDWVNKFIPLWDKKKITCHQESLLEIKDMKKIVGTENEQFLIRFGKVEGEYWVWNLDASERKKIAEKAEVLFIKKYQDPYGDDEDEFILVDKPFPKLVFEAIKNNCYESSDKGKTRFTLRDTVNLETELNAINWTLKIKSIKAA